jgi:oligopeptidase A
MIIYLLFFIFLLNKILCINDFGLKTNYYMNINNMNLNNIKNENNLPLFSQIEKDDIEQNALHILNNLKTDFKELENKMEVAEKDYYKLVVYELEKIQFPLNYYWGIISHLNSVKNNDNLRNIYDKINPEIIKTSSNIEQSTILYECLKKAKQQKLNGIQKRIIDSEILSMELNGVNLVETKKKEFLDIQLKLGDLETKFRNNVLDAVKDYKLIIKKDELIKQLPISALELYSENAKKEGLKSTPENGPWVISLDSPSFIPFMTYYPDSKKRKKLYIENIKKASTNKYNNSDLIFEILNLHQKMADLLGYKNYVEVSLAKKIANEKKINKLLNNISKKAKKKGKEDFEELKTHFQLKKLDLWDVAYYSEKLRKEKLNFDEEEFKKYLVFENVLNGLFQLSEKLFSINIQEVDVQKENIEVWNSEVKYFRVYDKKDLKKEIASFYLDPYVRPDEKKGGAWMDECLIKSKNLKTKPVAYLILNGTPPLNGKPSLMTIGEMETLFHEFGHGLQHMLTNVDEGQASGINGIEWDAVELPSQFMENWCYDKKTLMSFAKHFQTGEILPIELYNKLLEQKKFHVANGINRQIYFSMLDLYVYSNKIEDIYKAEKKIGGKYLVKNIDKNDRFLCSFEHIFSGGYSAGYYSYIWAEIMSLDAFSAFEEVGLINDEKISELGLKFRNTILAKGGGTNPLKVFKEFRGREPNSDAYMKNYGLIDN